MLLAYINLNTLCVKQDELMEQLNYKEEGALFLAVSKRSRRKNTIIRAIGPTMGSRFNQKLAELPDCTLMAT
jgi:hypothetical protein